MRKIRVQEGFTTIPVSTVAEADPELGRKLAALDRAENGNLRVDRVEADRLSDRDLFALFDVIEKQGRGRLRRRSPFPRLSVSEMEAIDPDLVRRISRQKDWLVIDAAGLRRLSRSEIRRYWNAAAEIEKRRGDARTLALTRVSGAALCAGGALLAATGLPETAPAPLFSLLVGSGFFGVGVFFLAARVTFPGPD